MSIYSPCRHMTYFYHRLSLKLIKLFLIIIFIIHLFYHFWIVCIIMKVERCLHLWMEEIFDEWMLSLIFWRVLNILFEKTNTNLFIIIWLFLFLALCTNKNKLFWYYIFSFVMLCGHVCLIWNSPTCVTVGQKSCSHNHLLHNHSCLLVCRRESYCTKVIRSSTIIILIDNTVRPRIVYSVINNTMVR